MSKPVTILFITPSIELLGARISMIQFLSHLNRGKYRPVVIAPTEGPFTSKLKELEVDTRIIKFGNWRKVKSWPLIPRALHNMTEVARKENAILWHSNEFWSFPYASYSARRLNIPALCHFRCSRLPEQLPAWKLRSYRVHKADRIFVVSQAQFLLFDRMKEIQDKLTVIHNGVDVELFKSAKGESLREEWGVRPRERLIGIIGEVSPHKGVDDFLRAAAIMAGKKEDLKFVVIGPDTKNPKNFTQRMNALAEELRISSQVFFSGFRFDVAPVMAALDLLLIPSRVEAFGRVIIESMAARTPTVAYRVGGIPEIISNPDVGVLVEPGDISRLADESLFLLSDDDKRNHMIETGFNHVNQHFTIQSHVRKIEKIYDAVRHPA